MKKINVGVIGLGNMGYLHLMNCLHIDDVNVVAVSDKSKRALKKAENAGVQNSYEDYQDLISKQSGELDAVVISLPNFLHFESIKLSLESGFDVFVEKPIAVSTNECREIIRLVEKHGRKLMPGHSMRFIPAIEKMRETVDSGKIGSLKIITIESIQNGPLSHGVEPKPIPEWWFNPKMSGGGALIDLGYHLIDLFRSFAGESHVKFSCLDYNYNLPVEDGATVILESENTSTRGIINVGWFEKTIFPRFNFRMILHGNADFISTEQLLPRNLYSHAVKEGVNNFFRKVSGRKIHPLSYTYYYESQFKELDHFFECIRNDTNPSISATDGMKTIEIIEDAYTFARTNQTHLKMKE
jgi:predicted dehydrogenase